MIYEIGCSERVLRDFMGESNPLSFCDDIGYLDNFDLVRKSVYCSGFFEHQLVGVAFCVSRDSCIIADDMGLGKTRSSAAAVLISKAMPCLVVCQSGMRGAWSNEIREIGFEGCVSLPENVYDIPDNADFVIVPYGRLATFRERLLEMKFQGCIIDEAHSFKNRRSLYGERKEEVMENIKEGKKVRLHRTEVIFEVVKQIKKVICLSGTPVLSRPKELYNLLSLTRHSLARNFIQFTTKYCNGHQTKWGWNSDGASNLLELREKLHNHVLRRVKKYTIELKKKHIELVTLDLEGDALIKYTSAWDEYVSEIKRTKTSKKLRNILNAKHLVQLNLLRQISSIAKVDWMIEKIVSSKEKFIVFSGYTETLKEIKAKLKDRGIKTCFYDGSVTEKKRDEAVNNFQNDPDVQVFIANTIAAKTGITLTKATKVYFLDLLWTPADHFQAEDRAYRIGQTEEVFVFYPVYRRTIEEKIWSMLNSKKSIISRIFDDGVVDNLEIDIGDDVVEEINAQITAPVIQDIVFDREIVF